MNRLTPVSRAVLVQRLGVLGFEGPFWEGATTSWFAATFV
jgi:hypothetical protein